MFNSIIALSEKHGLLRKFVFPRMKIEQLKVGPVGYLLLHQLRNEWFNHMIINKETSVFISDNDFEGTFQFAKRLCLDRLPFGIAEIIQNKRISNENLILEHYVERMNSNDIDFEAYFGNEDSLTLKCTIFTTPTNSVPFFHQWQRDRRIWWRKFSASPGRYSVTDIKTETNNTQTVQIRANYPWKSHIVETLALHTGPKYVSEADKFKDGKKTIPSSSIISTIHLNTLFMNTICDAYDESEYKGNKRALLRFHRKLAPYSISFAIASGGVAAIVQELNDLALHLTEQFRTNHLSTLFLPRSSKLSLEAQWRQYDEMGIPYNVVLNERTLKDGLVHLRNRDTTLKVHVSELVAYVEQLFKNY
ncbi:hypothetical protein HUJ05_010492 [Dendroctonus ponderosae]|nr:hypothetical protein HUJ05_010492 [Dendroctonus ponderosae]